MSLAFRLDKVELTNFHQFERYSVDFDERLTVLVGDNGAGKSSVLRAARVALGIVPRRLTSAMRTPLVPSDARIAVYDLWEAKDSQPQYPVTVSSTGFAGEGFAARTVRWDCRLPSKDGSMAYENADDLIGLLRECRQRVQDGDAGLVLPVLAYYGTGRLWANHLPNDRRRTFSRLDGYKGAFDAHPSKDQMLSWFFKMTAQDLQRAQGIRPQSASPLYAAVRNAVERCLCSVVETDEARVFYNLDADDLMLEYLDGEGEAAQLPLGSMSDGYQTTLHLFADIAYRMALLNPMLGDHVLETPGVVLIDEVDLHLHPLWQARILGDLRDVFPNVQFIVSTHAPIVVSSVQSRHVRLLRGGEKALPLGEEIYGSDVGRVLLSVMGSPERPVAVQAKFDEFYDLLDAGRFDDARTRLEELEQMIGGSDTGLAGAKTALALEEADARYASD